MIVPSKQSWWSIIFTWRGTALRRIWPRVCIATLLACFVTLIDFRSATSLPFDLTPLPFTLTGVALGIFLGFRNNTGYDRYWEGRKLWGQMVNTARTITRQVLTLIGPQPGESRTEPSQTQRNFHAMIVRYVAAYVHSVRITLRDEDHAELARLLPSDLVASLDGESNQPIALLQVLGEHFRRAWLRGWIHDMHLLALDRSLTDLCDIQGSCERIKATPIPFSYTALIHRIVAIYCFTLPFGIVQTVQIYTPIVVMIIAYAFFGLDAIGDELEDPFTSEPNSLPLTAITSMIELNVRERIGDEDIPPIPTPVNDVLL